MHPIHIVGVVKLLNHDVFLFLLCLLEITGDKISRRISKQSDESTCYITLLAANWIDHAALKSRDSEFPFIFELGIASFHNLVLEIPESIWIVNLVFNLEDFLTRIQVAQYQSVLDFLSTSCHARQDIDMIENYTSHAYGVYQLVELTFGETFL